MRTTTRAALTARRARSRAGARTSYVRASATACSPSTMPAPVNSFQRAPGIVWRAERAITSATCSEASRGSTCHDDRRQARRDRRGEARALRVGPAAVRVAEDRRGARSRGRRPTRCRAWRGIVENTPLRQSSLPPGAATLTRRLWVENAAGAPPGFVAATDRPMPRPPRRPPRNAAGNCTGLPPGGVARRGDREHVAEEREVERAGGAAVERVAGEAEVDDVGAVADRELQPADEVRRAGSCPRSRRGSAAPSSRRPRP